jgi:hypothetical protein
MLGLIRIIPNGHSRGSVARSRVDYPACTPARRRQQLWGIAYAYESHCVRNVVGFCCECTAVPRLASGTVITRYRSDAIAASSPGWLRMGRPGLQQRGSVLHRPGSINCMQFGKMGTDRQQCILWRSSSDSPSFAPSAVSLIGKPQMEDIMRELSIAIAAQAALLLSPGAFSDRVEAADVAPHPPTGRRRPVIGCHSSNMCPAQAARRPRPLLFEPITLRGFNRIRSRSFRRSVSARGRC